MPPPLFQQLPKGSRVLFIRLRNLGEAVLDTANLRALKEWRPDLQLTTLVEAIYTDLYAADPGIEAMPLERAGGDQRSRLIARLAILRDVRRRRFAAVINLHGGPTSAQLTLASGAPYRVGAAHFRPSFAYNLTIPPVDEILGETGISTRLHTVETQHAWFRWLGLPTAAPLPTRLHVSPDFRESAHAKLSAAGLADGSPYAVLAPTNEFHTKRWMPERFAAIADNLAARGFSVVLTGAPTAEQRAQMAAVTDRAGSNIVTLDNLRIGELVAVIAGARLFAGNDSGPAHIAAALGTPLVVLFGPASTVRWRPWNPDASFPSELVWNYFPCNPCSMFRCEVFPEPECIRSVTVEQVGQAIDRVLA